jgi:DNA repair exonuclease SbcCD ATPase subunit
MKIVSLTAENIKKLKAVQILPNGKSVVQIAGGNGQGKSSVLDAIYYAMAGTKDLPSQPIRKGQEKAFVKLDLGEIVVTRKFTAAGTTLTVEATNGARFPSPQKMLDDLLGTLSFDPLAFMRQTPKQQLDTLRGLVKLEVDVDALNEESRKAYDARTALNREVKQLEAQAAGIVFPPETPEAPLDVMELVSQLNDAGKHNTEVAMRQSRREDAQRQVAEKRKAAASLQQELDAITVRMKAQITGLVKEANDLEQKLATAEALPELIDTADLQEKIDAAQKVNAAVQARKRQAEVVEQLRTKRDVAEKLTDLIEHNTETVNTAIASAEMPVTGLTFGNDEVLFDGLPLAQAGGAEQLRISAAIAMSGNPKLRVLRIKDGSLLDEKGLGLLEKMATESQYQIWLERVDTSGKVGVVIEDGEVALAKGN